MCISAAPANFSGTMAYVNRVPHPDKPNHLAEVMIYQNVAESYFGPNALLLHIPAQNGLTQSNFLDFSSTPEVMRDMVRPLLPKTRGMFRGSDSLGKGVNIFDVGIYTVVLTQNVALIEEALERVPTEKRPSLNSELLRFYGQLYPHWSFAVCCFNNTVNRLGQPIGVWYESMLPTMRIPGLDSHTGGAPLSQRVGVDHWIMTQAPRVQEHVSNQVYYTDQIDPGLRRFLPDHVVGAKFDGFMPNGDFSLDPLMPVPFQITRVMAGSAENIPLDAAG